jgi:hypothetical protein
MAELWASLYENVPTSTSTAQMSEARYALACEIADEFGLPRPDAATPVRWDHGTAAHVLEMDPACWVHFHKGSTSVRGDLPALNKSPFYGVKKGYPAAV